jgi:hypothetical protein
LHKKIYSFPEIKQLGKIKDKTMGGQVAYPYDNSGWANKNDPIGPQAS